ncbi:Uncharacterised protein [Yersinia enterocolitica]|nr:hypothetical protein [Yersinia enterocolitica]AJI81507.1 hypothetical protein CH47_3655 [Yersinia enterocolitica]AJJ21584.1 hypothetical protein CH49_3537 [Yersinia enterocolitica]EKA25862.1 hypothetical protein YWA314_17115 [Yersinia enterocolitica subsp. enterocolitica WA-314]KGA69154.1 hypothetical protein DJ59_2497 [Yersinia enterocolitica]KGA77736.1 hypothetical protein DJ60_2781 [Yersinia enterocolitica]
MANSSQIFRTPNEKDRDIDSLSAFVKVLLGQLLDKFKEQL